jgi:cytochrome c-type protein NapB
MGKRTTLTAASVLALVVAAVAGGSAAAQGDSQTPIPDADISLAKGSVFDVPAPPVPRINVLDPGEMPLVDRAYPSAPPLVPHAVADFMPITRNENWCIDCHMLDWKAPEEGEPKPISSSHYVDLRGESDDIGEEIVGARWVCVSCHVPATDESALVGNTFGE